MASPLAPPFLDWPRIPCVGVGCIVERDGRLLLVRDRRGLWSTPGGHLAFGESPAACAARETLEEAGVTVTNVDFVAMTNDLPEALHKFFLNLIAGHCMPQAPVNLPRSLELARDALRSRAGSALRPGN